MVLANQASIISNVSNSIVPHNKFQKNILTQRFHAIPIFGKVSDERYDLKEVSSATTSEVLHEESDKYTFSANFWQLFKHVEY